MVCLRGAIYIRTDSDESSTAERVQARIRSWAGARSLSFWPQNYGGGTIGTAPLNCHLDLFVGYPVDGYPVMDTPSVLGVDSPGGKAGRRDHVKPKIGLASRPTSFSPTTGNGLRAGQRVCIESGPLRGLQAIVERIDANRRIVVSVSLAVNSISVELDSNWVKAID